MLTHHKIAVQAAFTAYSNAVKQATAAITLYNLATQAYNDHNREHAEEIEVGHNGGPTTALERSHTLQLAAELGAGIHAEANGTRKAAYEHLVQIEIMAEQASAHLDPSREGDHQTYNVTTTALPTDKP